MNLIQLRYIREIVRQGLSISGTADTLHTSQSGVSRQVQLLEEELNLQIFNATASGSLALPNPANSSWMWPNGCCASWKI